eukprot:6258528-Amphidinium_carterae.2
MPTATGRTQACSLAATATYPPKLLSGCVLRVMCQATVRKASKDKHLRATCGRLSLTPLFVLTGCSTFFRNRDTLQQTSQQESCIRQLCFSWTDAMDLDMFKAPSRLRCVSYVLGQKAH